MSAAAPVQVRPYKYLDYYRYADKDIFFGRRREIETLLADIISTRLVVLFAKTGSGKSSLIHAGIWPRLDKLNYRTVLTRVGADPVASIAKALREAGLSTGSSSSTLGEMLTSIARKQERPIAVFLDQFEEFFLSSISPEVRKRFIREVGELNRTPKSGVHLVFSLREDYLAEMDAFRDEIPTIFQKESQLRLRAFTPEQAKDAVEGPSRAVDPPFHFEDGLADAIVAGLPREGGLILPVSVQIVCDTLWQNASDGRITFQTYERLGKADAILKARITEDVGKMDADSLAATEELIPHLRTKDWTKQSRTRSELQSLTGIDAASLDTVIGKLADLHLLRVEKRESETVVEWVSDHVSHLSSTLGPTLGLMWVRRMRERKGKAPVRPVSPARIVEILTQPDISARLHHEDWAWLLVASAKNRDVLGVWFNRAPEGDRWRMLGAALDDPSLPADDVHRVLLFLGEFTGMQSIDLLAGQTQHADHARARVALRALGATRSPNALRFLQPALEIPELHAAALDALQTLGQKDALELAEKARKQSRSWRDLLSFGTRRLEGMEEEGWRELIAAFADRPCAVVIGPRCGTHRFALARALAKEFRYPFTDKDNLQSVLEYLNVSFGAGWQKALASVPAEPTDAGDEYAALAQLPAIVYTTTDPTNELETALSLRLRTPAPSGATASLGEPFVSHMNGSIRHPESLQLARFSPYMMMSQLTGSVLTLILVGFDSKELEGDARNQDPVDVRTPRERESWLGRLMGGAFAALTKPVAGPRVGTAVVVAPSPEIEDRDAEHRAREYYRQYAQFRRITFFWGTTEQFVDELMKRHTRFLAANVRR